jgi:16S rRNA (guanine527-N7)-methyltransferase
MHPARIAELLDPFLRPPTTATATPHHSDLNNPCHSEPGQRADDEPAVSRPANDHQLTTIDLDHISTYIDILLRWNAHINLTAIRDPEEIVTRHFGESLFAARHLFPSVFSVSPVVKAFDSVADLGSGAGFPGLPIKLWAPHISLTLIESNHKKAAFLREVTRALTLTDVNIQNARAETLTTTFDVVTLRAVERFDTILPTAASLVAPAGRLALLISSAQQAQAQAILRHLARPEQASSHQWQPWSGPIPIPQSRSRILLVARVPRKLTSGPQF